MNKTGDTHYGVRQPSPQFDFMMERWELPLDLYNGRRAMIEAGRKWLPQNPAEQDDAYAVRLNRSTLYNVFRKTIDSASGTALMKSINISNLPPELEYLKHNATGDGRSMDEVADELIRHHLLFGKAHILTDFPLVDTENLTYADFKNAGFNPYFNVVNPTSLVGWNYDLQTGYPRLTHIRVVENEITSDPDNPWLTMNRQQVKVWYNDRIEVYTHNDSQGVWELTENVSENILGYIPLTTGYSNKQGFLIATPPLEDLADVNRAHWCSSSDQNSILHIARVPILLASGFGSDELQGISIGPSRMITTTSDTANIRFVEHSGKAIEAGDRDLNNLERQMKTLGADLIMGKSADRQTATARQLDAAESLTLMQLTVRSTARMLEDAIMIAGDWIGVDASNVRVSIGDDLTMPIEPNPMAAAAQLVEIMIGLGFTTEDAVNELKRRGIIAGNVDYTEIMMKRAEEAAKEAAQADLESDEEPPAEEDEGDVSSEDDSTDKDGQ
jgi:hypothetical protein